MRIAVYPGSFDPVTNGHADMIERALNICDLLYVAVADNSAKQNLFLVEERIEMLKKLCLNTNVVVTAFRGLLVDFCRQMNISVVVRGLRNFSDFEYEYSLSMMNKSLYSDVDTVFLFASKDCSYISSKLVKEIASYGGNVSHLVPSFVESSLRLKFSGS